MPLPTRLGALALLLLAAGAMAQPVYRNVDKNGKLSFSDQPPAANAQPATVARGDGSAPAVATGAGLPYELRQVAQRYPVTLYTSEGCAPCTTARSMLTTRGIPFDERTVQSDADVQALQRLSGQNALPLLTIGAQQLKGYADSEWSRYLDAAGYPRSNQLPAGYNRPPAQPLVAAQVAPGTGPAAAPVPSAPAPAATGPTPGNPAGIRF